MRLRNAISSRFESADAAVLGISIDAQPAKAAWAQTLGPISFDLLSDFHPHGDVAQQYGVYREKDGISERAIFVVDKQGKIAWAPRSTTFRSSRTTTNSLRRSRKRD